MSKMLKLPLSLIKESFLFFCFLSLFPLSCALPPDEGDSPKVTVSIGLQLFSPSRQKQENSLPSETESILVMAVSESTTFSTDFSSISDSSTIALISPSQTEVTMSLKVNISLKLFVYAFRGYSPSQLEEIILGSPVLLGYGVSDAFLINGITTEKQIAISMQNPTITIIQGTVGSGVSEDSSGDFFVQLKLPPYNGNVVIAVNSNDTGEALLLSGNSGEVDSLDLIFNSTNWSTLQTIWVKGQNDSTTDGDQTINIQLSIDKAQTAFEYRQANINDLSVIIRDQN